MAHFINTEFVFNTHKQLQYRQDIKNMPFHAYISRLCITFAQHHTDNYGKEITLLGMFNH